MILKPDFRYCHWIIEFSIYLCDCSPMDPLRTPNESDTIVEIMHSFTNTIDNLRTLLLDVLEPESRPL